MYSVNDNKRHFRPKICSRNRGFDWCSPADQLEVFFWRRFSDCPRSSEQSGGSRLQTRWASQGRTRSWWSVQCPETGMKIIKRCLSYQLKTFYGTSRTECARDCDLLTLLLCWFWAQAIFRHLKKYCSLQKWSTLTKKVNKIKLLTGSFFSVSGTRWRQARTNSRLASSTSLWR